MEIEVAKDKSAVTPGGKYRKDSMWLLEAFRKKGVDAEVQFVTSSDTAESLKVRSRRHDIIMHVDEITIIVRLRLYL